MFAYCGNNPVCYVDSTGTYPIYIVDSTKTETDDGTNYTLEIKYHVSDTEAIFYPKNTVSLTLLLYYSVSPEGKIQFSNEQPGAGALLNPVFASILIDEVMSTAKKHAEDAMDGRTRWGVFLEMGVHYIFTEIGLMYDKMHITDIGNTAPSSAAYDYNAMWFQKPIRSIPDIVQFIMN